MSNSQDSRTLLQSESSGLSDSSTAVESQGTPQQRHGYSRMLSDSVDLSERAPSQNDEGDITSSGAYNSSVGLGISGTPRPYSISIQRVPVGGKSPSPVAPSSAKQQQPLSPGHKSIHSQNTTPQIPGSSNPLLSPSWQQTRDYTYGYDGRGMGQTYGTATGSVNQGQWDPSPFNDDSEPYRADADTIRLNGKSMVENGLLMPGCTTRRDIHEARKSWLSVTILILSIYSTAMSGLWFVTALVQPRWGRKISSTGRLTPSTASLLSALFAKTIELSFVTVFVGFLGQVLSRRSFVKSSKGVSIAEMSMRTWIIQPGKSLHHVTWRYA